MILPTEFQKFNSALRTLVLCLCFGIASVALFLGIAIHFFVFKRDEHGLILLSLSFLALLLDIGITWILRSFVQRTFAQVFIAVSGAILIGVVLVSVAIWRGHWIELVSGIFRSTATTR